ncbi:MAG: OsmC family protein [Candidatus Lokiarchaeia archaeon]|nr:OsmC family protein [Candidatus Lokiarchaeia archaeon]
MPDEYKSEVSISLDEEMIFKCDLGQIKMKDLFIDEQHKKSKEKIGPNPSKLLALSILGCMSASFVFCLQKKDFSLSDFKGKAFITSKRNEKGLWRIKQIKLELHPKIDTPKMRERADQCQKFFEQFCIISESLKEGIEIITNLNY